MAKRSDLGQPSVSRGHDVTPTVLLSCNLLYIMVSAGHWRGAYTNGQVGNGKKWYFDGGKVEARMAVSMYTERVWAFCMAIE